MLTRHQLGINALKLDAVSRCLGEGCGVKGGAAYHGQAAPVVKLSAVESLSFLAPPWIEFPSQTANLFLALIELTGDYRMFPFVAL